jgi:GNAT superfamily N-acetyltransferase
MPRSWTTILLVAIPVELAVASDWPAIQDVFRSAGRAAWGEIFPADVLLELEPPERWRGAIGHEGRAGEVWVAREGSLAVGFVVLRPSGDEGALASTGEVDSFYTHPRVWGLGFGRALMSCAVARLALFGFSEATLWTEARNYRPRRFYEASGWALDGTQRRRVLRGAELVEDRFRREFTIYD